jgi:tRNA-dihydrouridine synthase C
MIWVHKGKPELILAPMEGVTDAPMRAWMGEWGGFSFCVSEFLRISQDLLPAKAYLAHVPEAKEEWRARGLPVALQLLGGDAELLARSALRGVELGAPSIDLNFGCPAPTVNRHDGGATLLKFPDRIESIVRSVRSAVEPHVPVSAKLRLGWQSIEDIHQNAQAAWRGGADWITIHARTRMQAYQPPVFWKKIREVRSEVGCPVVANGDIWTREDFLRCREETEAEHFMLGRGALADPSLPHFVAQELGLPVRQEVRERFSVRNPEHWLRVLPRFAELCGDDRYALNRSKQWLKLACYGESPDWFQEFKRTQSFAEAIEVLARLSQSSDLR